MRVPTAALAVLLALVPAAAGSTAGVRVAFTQANGAGAVVATYNADATGAAALAEGDSASWSPDGTRLVLASRSSWSSPADIVVVADDGTTLQRLTADTGSGVVSNLSPRWSPRGDLIAFLKQTEGVAQVWVTSPTGGAARPLTSSLPEKNGLQWSPDGSRLLWVEGGVVAVWDGVATNRLTPAGQSDRDAVWSPDGTRIAFVADGSSSKVFVMDADGSDRHVVAPLSARTPSWSPDGRRLAFIGRRVFPQYSSRYGPAQRSDIFTIGVDGSRLRRLTGPPVDSVLFGYPSGTAPSWWPDGSRLFFEDARGRAESDSTTFMMNADGTCEGLFAADAPRLQAPAWRPGTAPGSEPRQCVDLRVFARSDAAAAAIGKPVIVRLAIDNDGTQTATTIRVRISPSTPGAIVSGCGLTGCVLPSLPPHHQAEVDVAVRGNEPKSNASLTADVTADEPDSDPSTNTATAGVTVLPCSIVGTYGPDDLHGTAGRDRICALPGADNVKALAGDDYIDAGNGSDLIDPGLGRDTILAKGGRDTIHARDRVRDWIDCGTERDTAIVDLQDVTRNCETVLRSSRR